MNNTLNKINKRIEFKKYISNETVTEKCKRYKEQRNKLMTILTENNCPIYDEQNDYSDAGDEEFDDLLESLDETNDYFICLKCNLYCNRELEENNYICEKCTSELKTTVIFIDEKILPNILINDISECISVKICYNVITKKIIRRDYASKNDLCYEEVFLCPFNFFDVKTSIIPISNKLDYMIKWKYENPNIYQC